jgi:hypothetical protein
MGPDWVSNDQFNILVYVNAIMFYHIMINFFARKVNIDQFVTIAEAVMSYLGAFWPSEDP